MEQEQGGPLPSDDAIDRGSRSLDSERLEARHEPAFLTRALLRNAPQGISHRYGGRRKRRMLNQLPPLSGKTRIGHPQYAPFRELNLHATMSSKLYSEAFYVKLFRLWSHVCMQTFPYKECECGNRTRRLYLKT